MPDADPVAIGAPRHNANIPGQVRTVLSMMKDLDLRGKPSAAFGSYGLSGEAPMIADELRLMRMDA
ncbi:MAG: hypothetical protein CW694_02485 [Candidatus Syntrophoarchaeum sp. WYZ-LMO15]|nr:MAG: hypothetical protein CW694_02485 [Candidatus Syntrophoarchaeum sp. WYZ-LMO15]